jgi:hypothetical protein
MSSVTCRQCGREWPPEELVDVAAGRGCPACGGSPLCACCGHPRNSHSGAFGGGRPGCREKTYDFESLTAEACACTGFERSDGGLRNAPFSGRNDDDPLPKLRIA